MSTSILDTVLSRRDIQERESFDALQLMEQILGLLPAKEAEILSRRYGLGGEKKQTLETIGQQYQVTRERIRQIERQAIQSLFDHPQFDELMRPFEHVVVSVIHEHGGIMTMDMIARELLGVHANDIKYHAALHFLLSQLLKDKIEHVRASKQFVQSWKTQTTSMDVVEKTIAELKRIVEGLEKPHTFERIHEELKKTPHYKEFQDHLSEAVIASYLDVAGEIGKNPFDEYGLSHWGLVNPKRMHDRVYLVLQKKGEPMHFEEIAEQISEVFGKKAYPPTVHNELILNKEYVLVGRGLYALKEWGYQEGVVSDVITQVMEEAAEPLDRDEIVKRVLEQRIVKRNTIYLALTDKNIFQRLTDGRYTLIPQTAV
jgi:hypothetical protein